MAQSVEEHIAARKDIADDEMHHHGFVAGIANRLGLASANTVDRVTPDGTDKVIPFLGGALRGALQGAVLGLVAGCVLAAVGIISAPAGAVYGAMAIGAVMFGGYHAIKSVVDYGKHPNRKLSDHIAEVSGAVPRERAQELAQERHEERELFQEVRPAIFTDREDRRREHQHHDDGRGF
jgi:hypothetical protein